MNKIEIKLEQITRRNIDDIGLASDSAMSMLQQSPKKSAKRVGITTLGCKVNTFESELISEALQADDWSLVSNREAADLYLINTCTVTKEADRQARQEVRRAIKRNDQALVVVTGCYAQMDPQACANIPGVDLVLGNDRKLDVHQLLPQLQQGALPKVLVGDLDQHVSLPTQLLTGYEAHTRAFVQIQQGCDQGCTFCIIHVARGPSRSLPANLIKRQVQRLVLNDYPEIVICGVDLGSYGDDLDADFDLVDLLTELLHLEHDPDNPFRIRLSSIDPHHISDRLITLMAEQPRICPQIHLSMQSGNTLILKRMKRRYTAEFMQERISALRAQVPELVISADVMVGFPTETEEQFQDTEDMLKTLQIAYPHVFSYSDRDGTPAARIPTAKQVPVAQRKARNQRIRTAGAEIQQRLLSSLIGKSAWVLPETTSKREGFTLCRAENYVPVLVADDQVKPGKWQRVKIQSQDNGYLIASK